MNSVDCIQGDAEWFACRLGCVTSSRVADVIAKRKKASNGKSIDEPLACRVSMLCELAGEILTGRATEHYVSRWMAEGKEKEPDARREYESWCDEMVEEVGYVYHPTIKMAGASPDGLLAEGMIEIKCPKLETHLRYLAADEIPEEYLPQMLWQLAACPEKQWIDFVSYHEAMRPEHRLFVKRLPRTEQADKVIRGMEGGRRAIPDGSRCLCREDSQ
jgi:hypothetical protein